MYQEKDLGLRLAEAFILIIFGQSFYNTNYTSSKRVKGNKVAYYHIKTHKDKEK